MNADNQMVILVVDDIAININLIKALLRKYPYEIIAATSGEQALQIAEERQPDLILLDIMMPDMDGHKVLSRLKANPKTQHIKVAMQTAVADEFSMSKAKELGAVGYISKPIMLDKLLEVIGM